MIGYVAGPGIVDPGSDALATWRSSSCQWAALEVFVNEVGYALSMEERRRLLEANRAAAQFFRRELLRTGGWAGPYLKTRGLAHVLTVESDWKIGYAPEAWSNLTEHLRREGFDYATLVRAGLVEWTDLGDAVDRLRDRLVLVARDHRLSPVGFISSGRDVQVQSASPVNAIHLP